MEPEGTGQQGLLFTLSLTCLVDQLGVNETALQMLVSEFSLGSKQTSSFSYSPTAACSSNISGQPRLGDDYGLMSALPWGLILQRNRQAQWSR